MSERNRSRRRRYDRTPFSRRMICLPLLALALTLYLETMARGNPVKTVQYIASSPLYFLYNVLLVMTTLAFSELFKRRSSCLFLLTAVWLGLGIAARVVAVTRTQPFTSMDVMIMKDGITLTTLYYTWPQIIAMYGGILLGVIVLIWVLTHLPRMRRVNYWRSGSIFAGLTVLCVCIGSLGINQGWFPRYYDNLLNAYSQYGFATCFMFTFGDSGVKAPEEYSQEAVTSIVDQVESDAASVEPVHYVFSEKDDLEHPNIVVVQLESLIDVNTIIGAKYSTDPTPNFNGIARDFTAGELYVPSIGGGTVNVEFEVLTGMNLDFFGVGEVPYNTYMLNNTCETLPYDLKAQGYTSTALHNHTGTFYSRYQVYPNMGFDHFVPLEYMPYITYTDVGWCQDMIMADEIMKALDNSESRDFVFAVTVESHGKYDEEYTYTEGDPVILEFPEELNVARFSNYIHLIHETDQFVGKLIKDLENYDEPTIVVLY
ncbi:MAG: LTA synthase family protein, partial [Clostridiales bacterium]|nr:LTA synthase family protein [Clostridiales bacterium]